MQQTLDVENFYDFWIQTTASYGHFIALQDDYNQKKYTFLEVFSNIKKVSNAMKKLGLQQGSHVALLSENCADWLICDQACLLSGFVNAIRGSGCAVTELSYIIKDSNAEALIIDNLKVLEKLRETIQNNNLKFIITLNCQAPQDFSCPVYSFEEILSLGNEEEFELSQKPAKELSTLIYTSGTTGEPKGVMLTASNILSQIKNIHYVLKARQNKKALSLLPIWHAYERTIECYWLSQGVCICYTNIKKFRQDIKKYQPNYFPSVPRIWDAIYQDIQKNIEKLPFLKKNYLKFSIKESQKFKNNKRTLLNANITKLDANFIDYTKALFGFVFQGMFHQINNILLYKSLRKEFNPNFIFGLSGGGTLQKHLYDFFDAIGISLYNVYGLTETSPFLTFRSKHNSAYFGTIGQTIKETDFIVIHPETKRYLEKGEKGILCIKGPQVMLGYYNKKEATEQAFYDEWFVTGDLVQILKNNSILITGRAKDTIVLSNGENIEPIGIEDACLKSDYIKQIVLVGQDRPMLGALVVPDYDNINNLEDIDCSILQLIQKEIQEIVCSRPNFVPQERIGAVRILTEEFTVENGLLTDLQKIKRNKVFKRYNDLIDGMYQ